MKHKRRFTLAKRQNVNYPGLEALRVYRCLGWLLKKVLRKKADIHISWNSEQELRSPDAAFAWVTRHEWLITLWCSRHPHAISITAWEKIRRYILVRRNLPRLLRFWEGYRRFRNILSWCINEICPIPNIAFGSFAGVYFPAGQNRRHFTI